MMMRLFRMTAGVVLAFSALTYERRAAAQRPDRVEFVAIPQRDAADDARALTTDATPGGGAIAGGLCLQPAPNCQLGDAINALNSTRPGFRVADDFDVAANGTISGVCWSGVYANGAVDCSSTASDAFIIKLYDDNNGTPGSLLGTFAQGANLTVSRASSGRMLGSFAIIDYSATLAGPAVLATNCYWLEVTNSLTGCTWYWETGAGLGSYAAAVQDENGTYATTDVVQSNLAFCINFALQNPGVQPCAPATPANDNCAQAATLSIDTPAIADLRSSTTNAGDPMFSCMSGGIGPGAGSVWYRFVATETRHSISTCSSSANDSIIAVYSGVCGGLTEIACNDDGCELRSDLCVENLAPGTTYYVQLAAFDEAARGVYMLIVGACRSCQSHNATGDYILSASITGIVAAYDDFQAGETAAVSTMTFQGIWWNGGTGGNSRAREPALSNELFTLRIFQQGPDGLPGNLIATRTPIDGSLTLVSREGTATYFEENGVGGFQDDFDPNIFDYAIQFTPVNMTEATCYWMTIQNEAFGADAAARFRWIGGLSSVMNAGNNRRAFDSNNNGVQATDLRTGDYIWCLGLTTSDAAVCDDPTPPANDACANAIAVACGGAPLELFAHLQNATADASDPMPTCIGVPVAGTVWYRITTGAEATSFLVDTCLSDFSGINDPLLAVYAAGAGGCAGSLTEVGCANDNCGEAAAFEEVRIDPALPNTTYYVMLAAPNQLAQLSYRIRFRCPAPPTPPNDACGDAIPLAIGSPLLGTTVDSTLDLNAVAAGVCDGVSVQHKGVWHSVVGNGRTLEASICAQTSIDSLMTVYCATCDTLTCVTADDDGCGQIGGASRVQWCAKLNATYLILVHNFPGESGGTYEIVVNDIGSPGCTPSPDCPLDSSCISVRGDLNCDGLVNFFDVDPFVLALFDLPQYQALFCDGAVCTADIDCTGVVNFFDIYPFVSCLFEGCPDCAP